MTKNEHFPDTIALTDIDGTVSDTQKHMTGLNQRLGDAFPLIKEALPDIKAKRHEFRNRYKDLSFAEQDEIWQQLYPGTTSHSQLDIYRVFAPDVFDESTTAEVDAWLANRDNFGHAEFSDAAPMMRELGTAAVSFTLGQRKKQDGTTGWQVRKIDSSPILRSRPSHIAETLPRGGKGEVIAKAYNKKRDSFVFPLTDGSRPIERRNAVMIEDSEDNLQLPPEALGILIDRKGKKTGWDRPKNVQVARSLEEVPEMIAHYEALREQRRK